MKAHTAGRYLRSILVLCWSLFWGFWGFWGFVFAYGFNQHYGWHEPDGLVLSWMVPPMSWAAAIAGLAAPFAAGMVLFGSLDIGDGTRAVLSVVLVISAALILLGTLAVGAVGGGSIVPFVLGAGLAGNCALAAMMLRPRAVAR